MEGVVRGRARHAREKDYWNPICLWICRFSTICQIFSKKSIEADKDCEEEVAKPGCSGFTSKTALSIEQFTIYEELGRGSFGKVMLVQDKVTSEFLGMKIVNKRVSNHRKIAMVERRVLEVANDCPFLTHVRATFQTQHHLIYVLEFVSGGTLGQLMKKKSPLTINEIKFLTAEMVCAIQFLHSRGIVHRDIKPANILLDRNGHIKVADFGVALENMYGEAQAKGFAGTLTYIAPEVLKKNFFNASVDWWALGIVLSEMATGSKPFINTESTSLKRECYPLYFYKELTDILKRLWIIDPVDRLKMAQDIRSHQFFQSIDWEKLELRLLESPISPPQREKVLQKKTDKPLTSEGEEKLSSEDQELLKGFTYVSPEWRQKLSQSCLNRTSGNFHLSPPSLSQTRHFSSISNPFFYHPGSSAPFSSPFQYPFCRTSSSPHHSFSPSLKLLRPFCSPSRTPICHSGSSTLFSFPSQPAIRNNGSSPLPYFRRPCFSRLPRALPFTALSLLSRLPSFSLFRPSR